VKNSSKLGAADVGLGIWIVKAAPLGSTFQGRRSTAGSMSESGRISSSPSSGSASSTTAGRVKVSTVTSTVRSLTTSPRVARTTKETTCSTPASAGATKRSAGPEVAIVVTFGPATRCQVIWAGALEAGVRVTSTSASSSGAARNCSASSAISNAPLVGGVSEDAHAPTRIHATRAEQHQMALRCLIPPSLGAFDVRTCRT
jgi:hypothetical protein